MIGNRKDLVLHWVPFNCMALNVTSSNESLSPEQQIEWHQVDELLLENYVFIFTSIINIRNAY